MNTQIDIVENGTTTLATAGKYCDRNIDINVNTPDRYEEGKKAELDAFWDELQGYGKRSSYSYAFWQAWWNDKNYNPKYPLVSSTASNCFYLSNITDTKVDIHFTGSVAEVFRNSKIKTIRKIILSPNTSLYRWFEGCPNLENVTFEGTLETKYADFKNSPKLTHDSLMSLINALADKTADTSGTVWTVTLGATNLAKLTEEELLLIENKGWGYA